MLKETLILFLNHQQASPLTTTIPESTTKILPLSLVERKIRAAITIQVREFDRLSCYYC